MSVPQVWVRGGYYSGAEEAYIMAVTMSPPAANVEAEGEGQEDTKKVGRESGAGRQQVDLEKMKAASARAGVAGERRGLQELPQEARGGCRALAGLEGALVLDASCSIRSMHSTNATRLMMACPLGVGRPGFRGESLAVDLHVIRRRCDS